MEPYRNIKREQDKITVQLMMERTRPSTKSLTNFGYPNSMYKATDRILNVIYYCMHKKIRVHNKSRLFTIHRVRSFGDWIKIGDTKSPRSWYMKETDEFTHRISHDAP